MSTILQDIHQAAELYPGVATNRYAALLKAESYSNERLDRVRNYILDNPPPSAAKVHTIAAAGSLARLESSEASDLDLIIVTVRDGGAAPDHNAAKAWRDTLCTDLTIAPPNPEGVFHEPVNADSLTKIAGYADEPYAALSKRVLFLLESHCLYKETEYQSVMDDITLSYAKDVKADNRKNFVFLLNDVIRFFRTICVNYQFNTSTTTDGKWPIRNVKLRHSRVLMYFSMVAALGTLSREHSADKIAALRALIKMPPLRRLFVAYALASDGAFFKVAAFYNTFLWMMAQPATRKQLHNLEYGARYESEEFALLKGNSDALASELLRFYEARRGLWDDRFFEYMIL
jgi:hypothetical protein